MIEEMLTVTKQKDMSGFYRHLYRQTMGEEKGQKEVPKVKTEPEPEQVSTFLNFYSLTIFSMKMNHLRLFLPITYII